jgi:hypothetical protein
MADRKYELLANMTNGDTDLVIGEITVYDGEDGFAPIVSLSKTDNITTLEITDKNGL